eukprot:PhF_6_TR25264/c0_g1_i1/m.34810
MHGTVTPRYVAGLFPRVSTAPEPLRPKPHLKNSPAKDLHLQPTRPSVSRESQSSHHHHQSISRRQQTNQMGHMVPVVVSPTPNSLHGGGDVIAIEEPAPNRPVCIGGKTSLRSIFKTHDVIDVLTMSMKIIMENYSVYGPLMKLLHERYEAVLATHKEGESSLFSDMMLEGSAFRELRTIKEQRDESRRMGYQLQAEIRRLEKEIIQFKLETKHATETSHAMEVMLRDTRQQLDLQKQLCMNLNKDLASTKAELEDIRDRYNELGGNAEKIVVERMVELTKKYEELCERQRESRKLWVRKEREIILFKMLALGQDNRIKKLEDELFDLNKLHREVQEDYDNIRDSFSALHARSEQESKELHDLKLRCGLVDIETEMMHSNPQAMQKFLEQKKREKESASGGGQTEIFFRCQGLGRDVPPHLRLVGKVKNLNLDKATVEQTISDVWTKKQIMEDKEKKDVSICDALFAVLKEKLSSQELIAEFGYSFEDALTRFKWDPDCELFRRILHGELHEEAFVDQMKHIEALYSAFKTADCNDNDGIATHELNVGTLIDVLEWFFHDRNQEQIDKLKMCLSRDQKGITINYDALFRSNEDGDQGMFIEEVRDQHLDSIVTYQSSILDLINECASADNDKVVLGIFKKKWIDLCGNEEHVNANLDLALGGGKGVKNFTDATVLDRSKLVAMLKKVFLKKPTSESPNVLVHTYTGALKRFQSVRFKGGVELQKPPPRTPTKVVASGKPAREKKRKASNK